MCIGETTVERVRLIGQDTLDYRKWVGLSMGDEHAREQMKRYIHQTGADLMKMQLSERAKKNLAEQESLKKRRDKVTRILSKKVGAIEMDDGIVEIMMDQEWV